jgi:MoxR-like ATPase
MTEKSPQDIFGARTDLSGLSQAVDRIRESIAKVVVGQSAIVDQLIVALLANGHVLIEGVPGVAKTLMAKLMARSLDIPFSRIQFTPDLMPSDVVGTSVFHPGESRFEFRRGPVFSGIVLIDEINRSPAKTQSALFEVMEERQVTVDGHTYPMQHPFMVLATQNPVEHEGTYRLPEAQLDRFLFKVNVPYPTLDEEVRILESHHAADREDLLAGLQPVLDGARIAELQQLIHTVHMEPRLLRFIASLVTSTRENRSIFLGASPRASVAVLNASKAMAGVRGRDFVTPEDILEVLPPVLRHRIMLTPEREMEGVTPDEVIAQLIKGIEIPR